MIAVSSLNPDPAMKAAARQRAEQALAEHDYVSVFEGVYVVALKQEGERAQLDQQLGAAISSGDTQALLLISPSMPPTSGAYLGRLAPTIWPEVNKKIV